MCFLGVLLMVMLVLKSLGYISLCSPYSINNDRNSPVCIPVERLELVRYEYSCIVEIETNVVMQGKYPL